MRYWDWQEWCFAIFIGAMLLLIAVMLFVYVPTSLRADAACLEAGYPTSSVAWNLKAYCVGIDGAVVDRVDAVPK